MKRGRRLLIRLCVGIPLAFVLFSLGLVYFYKWAPVSTTPLMIRRMVEHRNDPAFRCERHWTPLSEISPDMIKAAVASEDMLFYEHDGFDWEMIRQVRRDHREKGTPLRGCSTISQQTAKNVFTWGTATWARKAIEAWWTVLIEKIWGKDRIMEVYLNVAETGAGAFGAEAAAQRYYDEHASELTLRQACELIVCFPNPQQRDPAWARTHWPSRIRQLMNLSASVSLP